MEKLRLDKIIADAGIASRREAAQLIKSGFVTVDGAPALSGAEKYDPAASDIAVGGRHLSYKRYHYFMMNKPAGCVSATEDREEKTVLELLSDSDRRLRLFPAGRLDKDAEGFLILTDDGDFAHRIITPSKNIYKTYYVETDGRLTGDDVRAFSGGIVLKDGLKCLPAALEIISSGEKSSAAVRIREGKYHQVKRMLASRGKPVTYLKRTAVGGLTLDGGLAPGAYREMTADEIASVFREA
ncbi:16S rRNA pseudouridine516 synthase [Sporobacter termitidis DSM 10068]|uniref:Pseudouridine synthase n=1 Tax=Sporobacter termitidis DSM 10068 TaxID=1123282 RepID=A0A1M5UMA3_9FIRM|nr:pseudouridine synthase [Sporobacter termitidis]SHH64057.1 16S rRNA pseudouridine516 synthase [Sporobacter termitidis DSM 10068]